MKKQNIIYLKGEFTQKIKILSLINHPHVVQNP